MSIHNAKFSLTLDNYAERAQLANSIKDECARAEGGEEVDLKETVDKLDALMRAMKNDLVAIGKPKTTEKLHRTFLAHRKDLIGLSARVNVLSAKTSSVPVWVKPVGFAALAVGGLALAFAASRSSIFSSIRPEDRYTGTQPDGSYPGTQPEGQFPGTTPRTEVSSSFPSITEGHYSGTRTGDPLFHGIPRQIVSSPFSLITFGCNGTCVESHGLSITPILMTRVPRPSVTIKAGGHVANNKPDDSPTVQNQQHQTGETSPSLVETNSGGFSGAVGAAVGGAVGWVVSKTVGCFNVITVVSGGFVLGHNVIRAAAPIFTGKSIPASMDPDPEIPWGFQAARAVTACVSTYFTWYAAWSVSQDVGDFVGEAVTGAVSGVLGGAGWATGRIVEILGNNKLISTCFAAFYLYVQLCGKRDFPELND